MYKWLSVFIITVLLNASVFASETATLLNVSYDPTRELYEAYNPVFAQYWKDKTGQEVKIRQSHGASGKQARSVIEGLRADVVTLALAYDIDEIARQSGLLPPDWQSKLPHNSTPYNSVIVFVVRKGNPKHILDWDDLVKDGVQVITPSPKTSGGARWNYMAAWAYAMHKNNGDEAAAKTFITQLFKHVPVLDTGARGATTTFIKRGLGDVLIAWENEALMVKRDLSNNDFDIVTPSISILAEPPVAVIEKNAKRNGNIEVAREYLAHLYSKEAQAIIAEHYYRPLDSDVAMQYDALFPKLQLTTIADFGGWQNVQQKHFADGGIFDQIYMK